MHVNCDMLLEPASENLDILSTCKRTHMGHELFEVTLVIMDRSSLF